MSDVAIQNSRKHETPIPLDCVASALNDRKANPLTPNPLPEGEGAIVSELANYTSAGESKRKAAFTRLVNPLRSGLDSLSSLWLGKARNPRIPSFAGAHSSGFTLAEVLITLTILGVIAALVIPNMMQRYQEKVTVAKVRKTYHTLNNAIIQAQLEKGPMETWDVGNYNTYEGAHKVFNILSPYLEVVKDCENKVSSCYPSSYKTLTGGTSYIGKIDNGSHSIFLLKDGIAVSIWSNGNDNCHSGKTCFTFTFDINRPKGPNRVGIDFFDHIYPKISTGFPYNLNYKPSSSLLCNKNDSSNNQNGRDCIYWILHKGNMDYLRRDITEELSQMAN